ncbi:putative F-box domain-containing protein [Medicago truncatula]|uniref:Putative F-box domain-containing protein n=1 Tax=Medicago truncatula TaxID=3880 RepID=A0A396JLE7_MEDTR|nr:putative F-box domain-containing protein [Medicago truncatula]
MSTTPSPVFFIGTIPITTTGLPWYWKKPAMSTIPSPVFFSDDLLVEILSLLSVKSLLRFRCVSKSWNALISDPFFVKFHLKRSKSQNQHLTLVTFHVKFIKVVTTHNRYSERYYTYDSYDRLEVDENDYSFIPYPISCLLDNLSITLVADPHSLLKLNDFANIVGSCNGLICLTNKHPIDASCYEYRFRLWNPATRKISQIIGSFRDVNGFIFNFGCDNSTGTFKVVASCDNVWRNIESFPVIPLRVNFRDSEYADVFLNGTLNWLAVQNDVPITRYSHLAVKDITVEQIVIVSLNLGTETYNQYRLPQGFAEVPLIEPTVGVLGDCLCFSYSYKRTNLIIWQMKEFGVDESWTQFLKYSYYDLQLKNDFSSPKSNLRFMPLFLSKDGDTVILKSNLETEAIIYNWRDCRVERTRIIVHKTSIDDGTKNSFIESCLYLDMAKGYVESLISIC